MPARAVFLTVSVLISGCAAPPAMQERLPDEDVASLVTPGAHAEAVRALLGPPDRSTFNTWEYRLAGFNRPRTLFVRFSADDAVKEVYVLERRGASQHRRIAAR